MERVTTPAGTTVSVRQGGSGPPLVLVHGAFSDHVTNWQFVKPMFEAHYTVYAIARRGRGETDATTGHSLEDEGRDVGHRHRIDRGTRVPAGSLLRRAHGPRRGIDRPEARPKLVLYEPAWPQPSARGPGAARTLASAGDWDGFAMSFFRDALSVPPEIGADAQSRALVADRRGRERHDPRSARADRYRFTPERFGDLRMPVLLQIGTESPRDLYVTDALAAVLRASGSANSRAGARGDDDGAPPVRGGGESLPSWTRWDSAA